MSREDIIRYNEQRSTEEAQENGRKGGVASGISRRRKRALRDAADYFLSLPVTDNRVFNKLSKAGVEVAEIDNQMAMICGLHAQAARGDAKAAKVLVDILGEKAGNTDDEGVQIVDDL